MKIDQLTTAITLNGRFQRYRLINYTQFFNLRLFPNNLFPNFFSQPDRTKDTYAERLITEFENLTLISLPFVLPSQLSEMFVQKKTQT